MSTLTILPVKSFGGAKRRLEEALSPGPRSVLAEAMFCDVLIALRRAKSVEEVLVVTGDHAAQRIAGGYGAEVLDDSAQGHNAAAMAGIRHALEIGAERVLLLPGDCPLADPGQLDELLARPAGSLSALIVPDRHGTGTNALLLTPPSALEPSFGPDSCQRHAANAQAEGIEHEVVEVPSLALDIDTPEDLAALRATLEQTRGNAAHTRGMLSQLDRSQA
jgi:2-phospho-L-lactate guanylyltransferase